MIKICKIHGETEFSNNKRPRCKKCASLAVSNRRRKIKQLAIDYKGGKCEKCGYNKYVGALDFHHLDPNKKGFGIGNRGHCNSWDKVKVELDKCILVCANCHREIHSENVELA